MRSYYQPFPPKLPLAASPPKSMESGERLATGDVCIKFNFLPIAKNSCPRSGIWALPTPSLTALA